MKRRRPVKLFDLRHKDVSMVAKMAAKIPLLRRYGWEAVVARKIFRKAVADPANDLLVAKNNEDILGFAWLVKEGAFARSAYLRLIAVDPSVQRSGVGRALMEELESRHLKPHGLFILVTSTNDDARRFYEELDYLLIGEIPDYVKKGFTEAVYYKPPPATGSR